MNDLISDIILCLKLRFG